MIPRRAVVLCIAVVGAGSCSSGPSVPTELRYPPTISCPLSVMSASLDDKPVSIAFAAPTTTAGTAPVTVTCSSQSGTGFPVGTTTVTCSATDAVARQATCAFTITVKAAPKLSKTSFLAFGDSITLGVDAPPISTFALGDPWSYPYQLNDLLLGRYTTQGLTINNAGRGGEAASLALTPPDGRQAGEGRLRSELQLYRPQVLLLMEGSNDLYFGLISAFVYGIDALDRMTTEAQGQGVQVFLATIPPQRSGGALRRDEVAALIPGFNSQVAALASRKGAVLVDVYTPLNADLNRYIGNDDLHPTVAGFKVIADTFAAAIRANLETASQAQRVR